MKYIFTFLSFITYLAFTQQQTYISTKVAIEDLNFMVNAIEKTHYNPYFKTKKEVFDLYKEEAFSTFNPDSIPQRTFVAVGMTLAAKLSGGHTAMGWRNKEIMPELFANYFIPFTGKLSRDEQSLIISSTADTNLKERIEILKINDINISDLFKECMNYTGGIDGFKKSYTEQILPIYLYFTNKISAPYTIEFKDSNSVYTTKGINATELNLFFRQKSPKKDYTFNIVDDNIALITYNKCQDYKAFKKFLKKTFKAIDNNKVDKLVVDIRENGGGNSSLNDLLLSYITKKSYRQSSGRFWKVSEASKKAYKENNYAKFFGEDFMTNYYNLPDQSIIELYDDTLMQNTTPKHYFLGKTCVLIGPNTFSSANFLADAIKTYNLSTLIGSPTGEDTNDFGEQIKFQLPNSGNDIYVSSTYDIGANGDPNIFAPVMPDITIQKNVLAYAINWLKSE